MTDDELPRAIKLHRRAKTKTFEIPKLSAELALAIDAAATLADAYLAEEELRQEIGNLLDHWKGVPNDLKNRETLGNLPRVMERIRKLVEERDEE